MDEGKLSGRQILDHFANRLHSLEASLTRIFHVKRLPRAPSDVAELDRLRNTYDAEPVIFPATWIPCWTNVLESSSVLQGLESLLSGIVQVDAFQLQYKASNDEESKDEFQGDSLHISTLQSQEQLCKMNDQSKRFYSLHLVGERENTQYINFNSSLNRSLNRGFSNDEDKNDNSMVGNTYSRSLTATAGMCVETTSVFRPYHPIPFSSSEVIDFGSFMSELNSALLHKRDQLWYLTWRGIPSLINLERSLVPTEFDFWIRSLFYPTTSPQFISEDAIVQRNLWVGAIVTSRIHFDALDNIHVCISGKKLIHLYPPSALVYIHPKPWREGALNNFSSIESIFLANWRQHANFLQNAKCWRAEVKAGEAIFIPAGWWHEVFTFEESVSANVWLKPNQVTSFRATLMHLKSESYYKFMLQRTER